ncbi:endolytic transglycosylase MltG [Nocardia concava]|uniref:endolytic transglycosylase MltG n=1 Tax=Nocardia concava TaxID=257281 RepID=UPI0002F73C78|nr:endolytic transglycosylase MltG [Nocardia concava]
MTDRWTRAEERYRQNAERRYRRDDLEWSEADDYEDDTTVIPRYEDERYDDEPYEGDEYDEPPLDPEPPRRSAPQRADRVGRRAPERPARVGSRASGGKGRGGQRPKRSRMASRKAAERKRRRRNLFVIAGVFAILFVGAVGFAGWKFVGKLSGPADFSGPQGPLVIIQIKSGDTATNIAQTMADKGVVQSSGAFYEAAVRNTNMSSIQPGYYAVPSHSKGAEAVTALFAKDARVGNVVISEGRQLHDSTDVNTGARKDGIYRKIADASCVGTGTAAKCVTYEQLDQAGAGDPVALGVPAWALDRVKTAPDRSRQLEGLIAGGTMDFDPAASPQDILKQLVTASARSYEASGLQQSGAANGLSPYDTLIAASLVEREALPQDMSKVARVIVNRLAAKQKLEFDSTVNYSLAQTEVATTDADRAKQTPWNTYAMVGLPATPISAPSLDAMRAMENPAPGPWLYFVTVDKQGTTLFTEDYKEHLRNIEKARQSGILDSGR